MIEILKVRLKKKCEKFIDELVDEGIVKQEATEECANPFRLHLCTKDKITHDKEHQDAILAEATNEIKAVIGLAAAAIKPVVEKYKHMGITDTVSRESLINYSDKTIFNVVWYKDMKTAKTGEGS